MTGIHVSSQAAATMKGTSGDRLAATGGRGLAQWQAGKGAHRQVGESLGLEAVSVPARIFSQHHRRRQTVLQGGDEIPVVATTAADNPQHWVARHEAPRVRHRGDREINQSGGTVLRREISDIDGDRFAVEGARRQPIKPRVGAEDGCHAVTMGLSPGSEPPIPVERLPGSFHDPVVQQSSSGTSIESDQCLVANPRHVRHTTDVEDAHRRLFKVASQGSVVEWRQWRAFAAARHVAAAKVTDDIDASGLGQERTVADLPGQSLFGPVDDGLTVKADHIDGARQQAGLCEQLIDSLAGCQREPVCRGQCISAAAQTGLETAAKGGVEGTCQSNTAPHCRDAVGLDERGVDSVKGCAAHQSDGPLHKPRAPDNRHGGSLFRRSRCVQCDACLTPVTPAESAIMNSLASELLRTIVDRGFMHQCTDIQALDESAAAGTVVGYIGFDCTAPSLHVGSMVSIMLLRHLQQCGHKPVVLMGGGTTKIGDPSFRDEARPLLDDEAITANKAGIRNVFSRYLTFGDGATDAVMVDNDEWLSELLYVPFLRNVGRHFSVNRMLSMESVKSRLDREQSLSFLEFNYMILQAFDFVELQRRIGCTLQMGGSDQWGNIVNGVELGRRLVDAQLFGLTTPLITTAAGAKMGKTASGAVWLDASMCSPWDFWQFWRNTADRDVGRFLRLFTDLAIDEIARLERLEGSEVNEAKKVLASEATRLCHGEAEAHRCAATARSTFEEGAASPGLPVTTLPGSCFDDGLVAFEAFQRVGLATTRSEARRLIRGGGARLNDAVIFDEFRTITRADLNDGVVKLSAGRKRHALIVPGS